MKFQVNDKALQGIAHFFSNSYIRKLVRTRNSLDISNIAYQLGFDRHDREKNLLEIYNFLYETLSTCYRNEYVFKNVLTDKVLKETHSIDDSVVLSEFRAANCKADLVVINGSTAVYEIKTDLDTFNRLAFQIEAYRKVFDNICVVTSPKQKSKIVEIIPEDIGIIIVDDNNQVTEIRKSISNRDNILSETVFDSLRKEEYLSIISEFYGTVVDVPNTQVYDICKEMFCRIPNEIMHFQFRRVLKQRGNNQKSFLEMVPSVLKSFAVAAILSRKEQRAFLELL